MKLCVHLKFICLLFTAVVISPAPLPVTQTAQKENEAPLQKRLDEVSEELRKSQVNYKSLQTELEKANEQQSGLAGETANCKSMHVFKCNGILYPWLSALLLKKMVSYLKF